MPDKEKDQEPERFNYYSDWKIKVLHCNKCGWEGTFEKGYVEPFDEGMECTCPRCEWQVAPILAMVLYPTDAETEANWDKISEAEKEEHIRHKRLRERWKETILKATSQLPDIDGDNLIFTWDFTIEGNDRWNIIHYKEKVIWKEIAIYESAERFSMVAEILQKKYGPRIADLVPTDASYTWLYGDSLRSEYKVEEARRKLKKP